MPKKTTIVIHHTWSNWGTVEDVRAWHLANGWRDIGYHYLITCPFPQYQDWAKGKRRKDWDGKIESGRTPETSFAAGVSPQQHPTRNRDGIHISLVGNFDSYLPTENQMAATIRLCVEMCRKHGINPSNIFYHRDFANKTCPGTKFMSRAKFRQAVKDALGLNDKTEPPKLVLNGNVVEGAFYRMDAKGKVWYATINRVRTALKLPVINNLTDVPVTIREALGILGYTIVARTDRLKERNRFDIRAE